MAWGRMAVLAVGLATLADVAPAQDAAQPVQAEAPAAALESQLLLALKGDIAVDASGAVTDVKITTPIDEPVRGGVEKVLRGWRFAPMLENGVPVAAQARVHVMLSAGMPPVKEIRLESVHFAAARVAGAAEAAAATQVSPLEMIPPRFPAGLLRANAAGEAMMAVRVGLDGKVEAAEVVQSALFDAKAKPRSLTDAMRSFEQAAERQARRWTFTVTVPAGHTPSASELTLYVPIRYSTEDHPGMRVGEWRLVTRTARVAPTWLPAEVAGAAPGVGEVAGSLASAANTGLRLVEGEGLGAAL